MTPDLSAWLTAPEDVWKRRARIAEYLTNEGYELPPSPPDADYGEAGASHLVRGQEMTVAYSVVDQGWRRVYHYVEREVDHIMLHRIERGDEWILEHLASIPALLRRGHIVHVSEDKVIYQSRRRYRDPDGQYCFLWIIVRRFKGTPWYVDTFYSVS